MEKRLSTIEFGKKAEDIALEYLLKKGLLLRDRNWRKGHKEIDIIMEGDNIHFIEVRSLNAPILQKPYHTINYKKQRNLIIAANSYLRKNRITKEAIFDIVSIVFYRSHYEIEYIPNAFTPFMNIK